MWLGGLEPWRVVAVRMKVRLYLTGIHLMLRCARICTDIRGAPAAHPGGSGVRQRSDYEVPINIFVRTLVTHLFPRVLFLHDKNKLEDILEDMVASRKQDNASASQRIRMNTSRHRCLPMQRLSDTFNLERNHAEFEVWPCRS